MAAATDSALSIVLATSHAVQTNKFFSWGPTNYSTNFKVQFWGKKKESLKRETLKKIF